MTVRRLLSAGILVVLVGALTSCGNTGGTGDQGAAAEPASSASPSASSSPGDSPTSAPQKALPACKEIWVTGQRLPKAYSGCQLGDRRVAADKVGCSSGQTMVHFGGRYYGVLGGLVERVPDYKDKSYLRDYHTCTG